MVWFPLWCSASLPARLSWALILESERSSWGSCVECLFLHCDVVLTGCRTFRRWSLFMKAGPWRQDFEAQTQPWLPVWIFRVYRDGNGCHLLLTRAGRMLRPNTWAEQLCVWGLLKPLSPNGSLFPWVLSVRCFGPNNLHAIEYWKLVPEKWGCSC